MTTIPKKAKAITFSDPLIPSILALNKTMTRRIVKEEWNHGFKASIHYPYTKRPFQRESGRDDFVTFSEPYTRSMGELVWFYSWGNSRWLRCPYGQPGDFLYVRETYYAYGYWDKQWDDKKQRMAWSFIDQTQLFGYAYEYDRARIGTLHTGRATGELGWYKRLARFMPRAASRLLLEITEVRCERLNDISEEDAVAEGVNLTHTNMFGGEEWEDYLDDNRFCPFAVDSYKSLWRFINGLDSWDKNEWVWVVCFKVVQNG